MKARDFRIGNIIHDPDKGADGYTYVTARIINALDAHPKSCNYSPIPLTEEWLVKLGFDLYEGGYSVDNEYEKHKIYYIGDHLHDGHSVHFASCTYGGKREDTIDFYKGLDYLAECKHIHQLQNLYYALTGTELHINTQS